ncbi:enolase C-terminal domain-like protein [Polaromonas sp. CT11-55]|uniref:enolase C-terminal domain-like protein n=1 Tax=Polaromonas sp. CT11-55 TaxID=3243045 RepID=UPI0039A53A46
MDQALRFRIEEIRFSERDVVLRLPFRFGAATVNSCPQVFVQARIRFADGSTSQGCAAEMMIPKWFDKNPALSNEDNFQQLRDALLAARAAYCADNSARTAWQHFAQHYQALLQSGAAAGLNPLAAGYGPALLDRAILDALLLKLDCSFAAGMSANAAGVELRGSGLAADLRDFDMARFMSRQMPRKQIAARHTVGLADAISHADEPQEPMDGLPTSLESAITRYGHRHFKIKLSGDTEADMARLLSISHVLEGTARVITLDGNEQYASAGAFADFFARLTSEPQLAPLLARTAFVEQPLRRDQALAQDVSTLARQIPLLVDESDATLDAFVQARRLGYSGVSSKSCKGFYKSIINAARCALWNAETPGAHHFLSGEDLTMQAGLGVQQDLALVGWLGLEHVERNGHHYVNGLMAAPKDEQQNLLLAHDTLYEYSFDAVRLRIKSGQIALGSLDSPGFGTGQAGGHISWDAMRSSY